MFLKYTCKWWFKSCVRTCAKAPIPCVCVCVCVCTRVIQYVLTMVSYLSTVIEIRSLLPLHVAVGVDYSCVKYEVFINTESYAIQIAL